MSEEKLTGQELAKAVDNWHAGKINKPLTVQEPEKSDDEKSIEFWAQNRPDKVAKKFECDRKEKEAAELKRIKKQNITNKFIR